MFSLAVSFMTCIVVLGLMLTVGGNRHRYLEGQWFRGSLTPDAPDIPAISLITNVQKPYLYMFENFLWRFLSAPGGGFQPCLALPHEKP